MRAARGVDSHLPTITSRQAGGRRRGSEDKSTLPVGVCSKQGKRPYQEDAFSITAFLKPIKSQSPVMETHYFGLYDGHAGGKCSKFLSSSLSNVLAEDPNYSDNLPMALKRSFHVVNDQFLRVADQMNLQDGSTCITVIIREDKYMIANVGDCRALLITGGKPIQLSKDQKPTNVEEQRRIAKLGGSVVNCMGVARVNGVLAVARAFGNRNLRHVIRPDAEITQRMMSMADEYLIIASDGMWDVLSNRDVAGFCASSAASTMKASEIAEELVSSALARGSMDNTTCICVKLGEYVKRQLGIFRGDTAAAAATAAAPPSSLSDAAAGEASDVDTGGGGGGGGGGRASPSALSMMDIGDAAGSKPPSSSFARYEQQMRKDSEHGAGAAGAGGRPAHRPVTTFTGSRQMDNARSQRLASSPTNKQFLVDHLSANGNGNGNGGGAPKHSASPIQASGARKRAQDGGVARRPTTTQGGMGMEMSGRGFRSLSDYGGGGPLLGPGSGSSSSPSRAKGTSGTTNNHSSHMHYQSTGTAAAGGGNARLLHSPVNFRTQQHKYSLGKF